MYSAVGQQQYGNNGDTNNSARPGDTASNSPTGDSSYEPFRQDARVTEKPQRHVDFHLPQSKPLSLQHLASKVRHLRSYKQLPERHKRFWNPIWLSGPSFLIFATWFMLLIIATAALYLISSRNFGITAESYANRYSWTYGPTAVLAVTLSLWFHIEFWCKELTPWSRLRKGSTPASHGVLADYFTKLPHSAIWTAAMGGDHAVWLSTLGTFLLQLAVIVSTSIIILEPMLVASSTKFTIQDSFMSSPPNISKRALTGNALIRYFGVSSRNLTYPPGTSANLTVARLLPQPGTAPNATLEAILPGVSASLDCEPIPFNNLTDVTSQPWKSILAPVFTTNISVAGCTIIGVPIAMGLNHNPPLTVNTLSQFQGWWSNYTCNDGVNNAQYIDDPDPPYTWKPSKPGFDDQRLVFTTSYLQWTARNDQNETRRTWVQNYTGVVCKPSYSFDYYHVRMSPQDQHTKEPYKYKRQEGTSEQINGFTNNYLGVMIKRDSDASRIKNSQSKLVAFDDVTPDSGYLRQEDSFFLVLSGTGNIAALSNQTELLRRVPEVFAGTAAQAFQEYFTISDRHDVDGTMEDYQLRLSAKTVPVGLVLGFLSVLVIISLALIFLSPWDALPSNPDSIAAKAKYLAASPALSYHLRALNGLNMQEVQARLESRSYKTVIGEERQDFVIVPETEPLLSGSAVADRPNLQQASNIWWRPLNHRIWFVCTLIFSPLAIIVVLEVLQHVSDTHQGIRDMTTSGTKRIWFTLIPATILSLIAISFQALHFNSCLTAPFNALKHGGAPHSRGLTVTMLGKTSPHVFFIGLKHRLLLPCMTALCVMVSAFLTIVVSGLYYVEDVPLVVPVTLQRSDVFNFTKQDLSLSDNLAGATTKLLLKENLAYPLMTYNDLVFPYVDVGKLPISVNGSTVDVQLPAIRPTLRCISNGNSPIVYERFLPYRNGSRIQAQYGTNISFPCPQDASTCIYPYTFLQSVTANATNFIIGRANDISTHYWGNNTASSKYTFQNGSPMMAFSLGNTSFRLLNRTTILQSPPQLHAFVCNAYMEEVQTNLTLIMPQYAISTVEGKLPTPIESTARNLTFSSSDYRGPIYINALATLITGLDGQNIQVDQLMDAIVKGTDNATFTDFLGPQGAAKLPARASMVFKKYMAQAISANFRVSPSQFNAQDPSQVQPADMLPGSAYNGTLTLTQRSRLKQDRNTKIALQVMLGVMTLIAIAVYLLTDRKLRLPTNPCSIAGTMVLLAGSEMINRSVIPEGSEWNSKTHIWDGWLFSLGWWSDGQGKRFGIDIGNANTVATNTVGSVGSVGPPGEGGEIKFLPVGQARTGSPEKITSKSYSTAIEPEQHELIALEPAEPAIFNASSLGLGWNDEKRVIPRKPVRSPPISETSTFQQQQEVHPGDLGTSQTARPADGGFDMMYDSYRSHVAQQYQLPR